MFEVKTKTGKIAAQLRARGQGHRIFNDRLVNGRRSLKVWGWTSGDYIEAAQLLEQLACKVETVKTRRGRTRLHVTE